MPLLRFYAEVNGLCRPPSIYWTIEGEFLVSGALKDVIEGFGAPFVEVDPPAASGMP